MEDARAHDVEAIDADDLAAAQILFATIDSPWVHDVDQAKFGVALNRILEMAPTTILSAHLPPINGNIERHLQTLAAAPSADPYVGPGQAAFEAILAGRPRAD